MADTYIKQELKRIFKFIAKWKGFKIIEWHIGDEHIHGPEVISFLLSESMNMPYETTLEIKTIEE